MKLWILFLLIPSFIFAIEELPWFGRNYEIQTRGKLLYQNYPSIKAKKRTLHQTGNDLFLILNADFTYDQYNGEIEIVGAETDKQHPNLDCINFTGRYQFSNDIIGDFLTLTSGFTITQAFKHSVHDISSFHHGKFEGAILLSAGKEYSCEAFWYFRTWFFGSIGTADTGSPWLRANIYWERNWWDKQQLAWFLRSLWGLGHDHLTTLHGFNGYGPIKHQSVDLGVRYTFLTDCDLTISLEYARRIYAKNFPAKANLLLLQLSYSFGL